MHFKHEMIAKPFTKTSNKVELRINCVRINSTQPNQVLLKFVYVPYVYWNMGAYKIVTPVETGTFLLYDVFILQYQSTAIFISSIV